jgi:hypothetical protein
MTEKGGGEVCVKVLKAQFVYENELSALRIVNFFVISFLLVIFAFLYLGPEP